MRYFIKENSLIQSAEQPQDSIELTQAQKSFLFQCQKERYEYTINEVKNAKKDTVYYLTNKSVIEHEGRARGGEELTEQQQEFYFQCKTEHYEYTVDEIKNAKKKEVIIVEEPLEAYKLRMIGSLSSMSLSISATKYPEYKKINAAMGIYSEEENNAIKNYSMLMRNEFYRLKELILDSKTKEEVDNIVTSNKFNTL